VKRRRHEPRRLGAVEITFHAVDSYLTRHPGSNVHTARADLVKICAKAVYGGRYPTGAQYYTHDGLRLVVFPIARRLPILLTVVEEK